MNENGKLQLFLTRDGHAEFIRKILGKPNYDRMPPNLSNNAVGIFDVFVACDSYSGSKKSRDSPHELTASSGSRPPRNEHYKDQRPQPLLTLSRHGSTSNSSSFYSAKSLTPPHLRSTTECFTPEASSSISTNVSRDFRTAQSHSRSSDDLHRILLSSPRTEEHPLSLELVANSSYSTTPTDTHSPMPLYAFGSMDSYDKERDPLNTSLGKEFTPPPPAAPAPAPAIDWTRNPTSLRNPLVAKRNANIDRMITEVSGRNISCHSPKVASESKFSFMNMNNSPPEKNKHLEAFILESRPSVAMIEKKLNSVYTANNGKTLHQSHSNYLTIKRMNRNELMRYKLEQARKINEVRKKV